MSGVVAPGTFLRALEVARAALSGLEFIALSARYGLPVPVDRLENAETMIGMARRELDELELCGARMNSGRVH